MFLSTVHIILLIQLRKLMLDFGGVKQYLQLIITIAKVKKIFFKVYLKLEKSDIAQKCSEIID